MSATLTPAMARLSLRTDPTLVEVSRQTSPERRISLETVEKSVRTVSRGRVQESEAAQADFVKAITAQLKTNAAAIAALEALIASKIMHVSTKVKALESEVTVLREENAKLSGQMKERDKTISMLMRKVDWLDGKVEAHGHHYTIHPGWAHGWTGVPKYSCGPDGYDKFEG